MHQLIDLDSVNLARGMVSERGADAQTISLVICSPSGFTPTEPSVYYPAESIRIDSLAGLIALHDLVGEMLKVAAHWPTDPA